MHRKPKVSVLTITYNQELYIGDALENIAKQQTDFNFEVIVADDCSTDRTPSIIKKYAKKYPKMVRPILRKKNVGAVPNSINTLQAATGEYIALCEGDDYWTDNDKLQKQADFLDSHKDYALCFHPVKVVFEDKEHPEYIFPRTNQSHDFTVERLLHENFIQTNSVMYRHQDYTRLPNNVLPLDWYLHLYHAQFGKIGFINKVMSVYRRHEGGIWWSSYSDREEFWKTYALENLNFRLKVQKMYQSNLKYSDLLKNTVGDALIKVIETDIKNKTDYLNKVLNYDNSQLENLLTSMYIKYEDITNQLNLRDKELKTMNDKYINSNKRLNEILNSSRWKMATKISRLYHGKN